MNPSERRTLTLLTVWLALAAGFEWSLEHRSEWLRPWLGEDRLEAILRSTLVEPLRVPPEPALSVAAADSGRGTGRLPYDRAGRLDVNAASREDLVLLKGVGPVLATRILDRRGELGHFRREDDLLSVRGIGPKTLAKLLPQITLGVVKDSLPSDDNTQ